jgi:putative ABC transport system ATP-binding protein
MRGLAKSYVTEGPPVRALRGADLTLTDNEFVAVMGPSGCGKSTLLNLVAGLDRPDQGELWLAGHAVERLGESALARMRRSHIGFVFQHPAFLSGADVLENVEFPALVAGLAPPDARDRAREVLDLLGLFDRARDSPDVLSGGQRQRLAIARALVHRPTLLLADEPTGSLDSAGAQEVLALFGRLHADGQTVFMVTHDPEVAAGADRVVHMLDGRISDGRRRASSLEVAATD